MLGDACRIFEAPTITGQELRELIVTKWGRSYDVRLHKRGRRCMHPALLQ
jgi:hypothetical protein